MASYTIEQHVQMIKLYYQNECSLVQTLRALRPFYGRRGGPSKSTLQRLGTKFETTGSVNNQPTPLLQRNARSAKNIAAVRESVQETPRQSISRRAQELGLSQTSTWRILRRDLGLQGKVSESNRKRKPETTCTTQSSNKRRRKILIVSPDEILEGDDKPGQSTSKDTSFSKSEEIQSEDEFIQGQTVEESVSTASPTNSRQSPRILKRKTQSNSKLQLNKSTDVNTSDVQAKNDVASSKPTRSKRQPVFSTRVQNTQKPKRKSPSKIQKRKSTDHVDDEFDIFAKDIAFQLRQLPYYNALQCQEKIKTIINQERFNAPQLHHQEIEKIIIKQEPGFSEEEPLQPVSSQETIQTIIKEEPVTSDDEYPHPVLGQVTIINQESAIKEDKLSGPVSCQEIINKKTTISEEEISHPVSGQEIMINKKSALREEEISNPVSSQETIQTRIYHIPPPMPSTLAVIKTEYVSCENEPVTSSIESVDLQ